MSVNPTSVVAKGTQAAYPSVWEPASILIANWAEQVEVTTGWRTQITSAQSLAEKRVSQVSKPVRTVSFSRLALKRDHLWNLVNELQRQGVARTLVPLASDHTRGLANVSIGGTTLSCKTTQRRFFVGAKVAIVRVTDAPTTDYEVCTIQAVADLSITLTAGTVKAWTAPFRVYPLIEADLVVSSGVSAINDVVASAKFTAKEVVGRSSLEALGPSGYASYQGYPIWTHQIAWENDSVKFSRPASFVGSGISGFYDLRGDRPLVSSSVTLRGLSRGQVWRSIEFFDDVSGSYFPFHYVLPIRPFEVQSSTTTSLTVTAVGETIFWNNWSYVGITLTDGTTSVRKITGVVRGSGVDVISWTEALVGTVKQVAPAIFCRFLTDELTERWLTDETVELEYQVQELVNEGSKTVLDPDPPPPGSPGSPGSSSGSSGGSGTIPPDITCRRCGDDYTGLCVSSNTTVDTSISVIDWISHAEPTSDPPGKLYDSTALALLAFFGNMKATYYETIWKEGSEFITWKTIPDQFNMCGVDSYGTPASYIFTMSDSVVQNVIKYSELVCFGSDDPESGFMGLWAYAYTGETAIGPYNCSVYWEFSAYGTRTPLSYCSMLLRGQAGYVKHGDNNSGPAYPSWNTDLTVTINDNFCCRNPLTRQCKVDRPGQTIDCTTGDCNPFP